MKVARADAKDLDAAMMLLGLLDTVSSGYYPSDTDDEDDGPLRFDSEDPEHLGQLWKRLEACFDAAPGFQGRVIFGAATLMDPRNEVIDPDADCLELHPKLRVAMKAAEQYRSLLLWTLYHHQGGSSDIGQPIRSALGMGQYDRMTDEQIAEGKAAAMPANGAVQARREAGNEGEGGIPSPGTDC